MNIGQGFFRVWYHSRGLNIRRGMMRLWAAISITWFLAIAAYGAHDYSKWAASPGKYQYVIQIKPKYEDNDAKTGFYSLFVAPTKTIDPPTFSLIKTHFNDWSEMMRQMQAIDFPDNSVLFLDADLTRDDKTYLSKNFWKQRQHRLIEQVLPWILLSLAPPFVLLLLGLGVGWVFSGFVA